MPYLNVTDAKNKLTSIKQREPIAYVEILWYYINSINSPTRASNRVGTKSLKSRQGQGAPRNKT
jgi:hypothetical protein